MNKITTGPKGKMLLQSVCNKCQEIILDNFQGDCYIPKSKDGSHERYGIIKRRYANGTTIQELAKEFNVTTRRIHQIITGL